MKNLRMAVKNRIAKITIDRPEARNAMSREMWVELPRLLERCWHDADIGCVVLTGTGEAFCAGGDVKAMTERLEKGHTQSIEAEAAFIRGIMESSRLLHEMPKPTLAVVNGACAGAGFSLALSCDLRLADQNAKFTTAFARVGGSGDFGGSWFLSKIIGTSKARELYYLARVFNGAEAADMGIVNSAVAAETLDETAEDWASQLANGPSVALSYMKRNMNLAEHGTLSQALDQEAMHMVLSMRTEDHKEAAQAFVEKRKPEFKGR